MQNLIKNCQSPASETRYTDVALLPDPTQLPANPLRDTEAAIVLGVSVHTMRRWRVTRKGPIFVRVGGAVRYKPSDLEAFVQKRLAAPVQTGDRLQARLPRPATIGLVELDVAIVLNHEHAKLPCYAHGPSEDAGADLYSVEAVTLSPGETKLVDTGLLLSIPTGYEGQIRTRSGLAIKGLVVANSPGTIDPGYRGAVKVILRNLSLQNQTVAIGDRIAQLVIAPYAGAIFRQVSALAESQRAAGGFGSTGS